ncbi:erg26, C-3 sterol dehydrogenase [Massospora cicadina]|nr:erg26, C-3 sterol dehydrogenase [Massospora cicadina]
MTDYALSKHLGESKVLAANSSILKTCSLILVALVGAGDCQISPSIFAAYRQGLSWAAIGDNLNLYDFTHVKDACKAHLLAANKLTSNPSEIGGQAFFIKGGSPVPFFNFPKKLLYYISQETSFNINIPLSIALPLSEIIFFIKDIINPNLDWPFTPFAIQNISSEVYFDITKARSLLNYEPTHSLDNAAKATAHYYLKSTNSLDK